MKPPAGTFDGHAKNEPFCLALAQLLGIPSASLSVAHFEGETAIVIERYDKSRTEKGVIRVHQEDTCQALGVPPSRKYENEGGPGAIAIVDLLRTYSGEREDDIASFLDALALNWLIAGTDAHAKNYSLLIGAGGRVRLAPLYDVASVMPYDDFDYQKLKLAMRIGRQYKLRDIGGREWRRLAGDLHLDPERAMRRVAELSDGFPMKRRPFASGCFPRVWSTASSRDCRNECQNTQ